MIQIMNKRVYKGPGIYVGRPSPLGNPYPIGPHSRGECIELYEKLLRTAFVPGTPQYREIVSLTRRYKASNNLILICWCAPLPCHGEIIARYIEHVASQM